MGGSVFSLAPPVLLQTAGAISQTNANSTTEAPWNFTPLVIPAGTLKAPRTCLKIKQAGVYQAGLLQSITPRIRLGPAATPHNNRTVLTTTSGAVTGLLNTMADTPWAAETTHVVMDDGTIMSSGVLFFSTSLTAAVNALVSQKAAVAGVNFDVDNILSGSAQWSAAAAVNQIVCTLWEVELLRPA